MTLYDAIFWRRSTRQFRMERLDEGLLKDIAAFYEGVAPLFPGISTEIGMTCCLDSGRFAKGLFTVKAPYYLSFYSEERDRSDMNAGYICEQLCLYMLTKGIASCIFASGTLREAPERRGSKKLVILIAFGKPEGALRRRASDAKRLPVRELCVYKDKPKRWMTEVIEAARLAPSALNKQPWRFVVVGNRIHMFSRRGSMERPGRWDEFNFGAMFSHIAVASEELWLEIDLIRLDNISQKSFKVNQYVLSAIVQEQSGRFRRDG